MPMPGTPLGDGEHGVRLLNRQGFVKVDVRTSYLSSKLAGPAVTLRINASEGCLQVVYPQGNQRSLPLKRLHRRRFSSQDYVERMQQEASTRASFACFAAATEPPARLLLTLT